MVRRNFQRGHRCRKEKKGNIFNNIFQTQIVGATYNENNTKCQILQSCYVLSNFQIRCTL